MQDSGSCSVLRWANLLRLWGPWAFAALAFLAFWCQKQRTSRWTNELGVWVPAFLPTSITKPWRELAQHPLCFTSDKWTAWAAFSSVFVGGQAVGTARSAETGAGVHGERVTWESPCYAAREEMVSCQLEQSPSAVFLRRQRRKAASLPFASTAVLLSCSYFRFSCMPSLRLQGFFCNDL